MDKRVFVLGLAVLVAAAALHLGLERHRRSRLAGRIEEAYELANPGSTVEGVTLIPEGSVYRAVFRLDGQLVEVHVDSGGNYIFPVSTDLQRTTSSLRAEKEFFGCLRDGGVMLYGRAGTNVTQQQFRELGGSIYLDGIYYDCSGEQLETCLARNVTSVPTWFIGGEFYGGVATVEDLERLTGCTHAGQ